MKKYEMAIKISIFVMGLFFILYGINITATSTYKERKTQLEVALNRAVIECYALEGAYPPDLEYIETHYGIRVDNEQFIVHYDSFADNIMPNIVVIEKNGGEYE